MDAEGAKLHPPQVVHALRDRMAGCVASLPEAIIILVTANGYHYGGRTHVCLRRPI